MRNLVFLIKFFLYWLGIFTLIKLSFLLYPHSQSGELSFEEVVGVLFHGSILDGSVTAYFTAIIALMVLIQQFVLISLSTFFYKFHRVLLFIVLFIAAIDMRLYEYWGFRLDNTPFLYLKTPEIAFGSLTFMDFFVPIIISITLFGALIKLTDKWLKWPETDGTQPFLHAALLIIIMGIIFIPARGGLGIAPVNLGSVYHSEKTYLNHAAINVIWNFGFSISQYGKIDQPISEDEKKWASGFSEQLLQNNLIEKGAWLKDKSDVLLIIVESLSDNFIDLKHENREVTPFLNQLKKESIYFSQVYSSGDRTDKGLVSILSGYPSQSKTSIINYPKKVESLPSLFKTFKSNGYFTSFLYGGNIDFAGMRAYIQSGSPNQITSEDYFPSETLGAKWGVHDHVALDTLARQISSINSPFFSTVLTLSSHEPFDVPGKTYFEGTTLRTKFINAVSYTDHALETLITKLKKSPKWDHLLVIIVADHGHRLPGNLSVEDLERFHIPMYWLGGALQVPPMNVDKVISQSDLPAMLLSQFNWEHSDYTFSKNSISSKINNYAFYNFKGGIGWITDSTSFIYDTNINQILFEKGTTKKEYPMAFKQLIEMDFNDR